MRKTIEKPAFRKFSPDALDDAVVDYVQKRGVPSVAAPERDALTPPGPLFIAPAEPAETVAPIPDVRRERGLVPLSLKIPGYVRRELRMKASAEDVTVTHLVLSALRDAGFTVDDVDMVEDGRRDPRGRG